jgi:hypothetical protein
MLGGHAVAMFVVIWLIVGVTLGVRLRVFALVPTIVLAAVASTIAGIFLHDQDYSIALLVVSSAIAVQLGYLGGPIGRENFVRTQPQKSSSAISGPPGEDNFSLPEGSGSPAPQ